MPASQGTAFASASAIARELPATLLGSSTLFCTVVYFRVSPDQNAHAVRSEDLSFSARKRKLRIDRTGEGYATPLHDILSSLLLLRALASSFFFSTSLLRSSPFGVLLYINDIDQTPSQAKAHRGTEKEILAVSLSLTFATAIDLIKSCDYQLLK